MADPDFEPSDEDLKELSREAFEGVDAANLAALAKLRQGIAALRQVSPTAAELRAVHGRKA